MFKALARWILREDLETLEKQLTSEIKLSKRLAERLLPYAPSMVEDGSTDNAPIIEFHMDLCQGLRKPFKFPIGVFPINSTITISSEVSIFGSKTINI